MLPAPFARRNRERILRSTGIVQWLVLTALVAALVAAPARAQDAEALRGRYAALRDALAHSPFGRSLAVESARTSKEQKGEVFSLIAKPFGTLSAALGRADAWCDILILQTNVKRCQSASTAGAETLSVFVARRPQDPLESAYQADFRYELAAAAPDYLRVTLTAPTGPLGTSDYRIALEATPLDPGRSFVHMSYSYSLGIAARLAVQAYLATSGRHKVGFSIVDRDPDGQPVYVKGVRGILERNAMRYYLAIEAYLGSLDAPPRERLEKRLRDWHAAIERYPRQLDPEMSRDEYVAMKSREILPHLKPIRAATPR